jgi:hypothetical protein
LAGFFAGAGCFHGGSQETGGATGFGFGFFTRLASPRAGKSAGWEQEAIS